MPKATGKAKHPHDASRPASPRVKKALAAGDMDALAKALTVRQLAFCKEYAIDFNGSAAAVRAGYSPKNSDIQAAMLMKNDGIRAYIEHLTTSAAAKIMSVDPDYVIQGITAILSKEQARDGDKLRGYELLARILGMFVDRQEITGKDGGAIEVEQRRIEEETAGLMNMLKTMRQRNEKKEVKLV